ncbi:MAG: TorF family putative porin [Oleiphilaceae bacterium]|nr:TorF family putative porin [Oleiphilaceae bacterium]
MTMRKKTLATQVAAAALTAGAIAFSAPALSDDHAESSPYSLTAGVDVSNIYLFRGFDLGADSGGLGLISGWLEGSVAGAYAGVWAASGDASAGTEYDLYAGYGFNITDDIAVDLNVTNFIYPEQDKTQDQLGFADFTEVGAGLTAYGAEFIYYNNVAGSPGYQYYSASYGIGPVSALVGVNDNDGDKNSHLDLSFQFNDELSFTASTILDSDDDSVRRSTLIAATYSLSFDL